MPKKVVLIDGVAVGLLGCWAVGLLGCWAVGKQTKTLRHPELVSGSTTVIPV